MTTLIQEKVQQAISILNEKDIDLWLIFVRETSVNSDPILPVIYGEETLTRQSALLFHKSGETIAIVGRIDAETTHLIAAYQTVIPCDAGISQYLLAELKRLNPVKIAINTSLSNVMADGLSYGMYQLLIKMLANTPFIDRLCSAEEIISALNGRKTKSEVALIQAAIAETLDIYQETYNFMQPGMTEKDIADFMHRQLADRNLQAAWTYDGCPAVNSGPDSPVGHAAPTDIQLKPGHLVHFDFGVQKDGYCSDIQRMVYLLRPGETEPPAEVQQGFDLVRKAVEAARAVLRPGITGLAVDQAARKVITDAGYPEYHYATGHQLGKHAHDGGGILGPQWEVYGELPNQIIEKDQVYTIELGIALPDYGYIGLEEDVLVTADGNEYLGEPQIELVVK
ncbi:MAG: Xaa-Pro peptidase family protein [Anaerolineaceae bacterium]|jgi:Xaa-Pro aminopeptidase|nr:Xaa-Pro peptidase family protein [Anaerolineaceae bacterium]